MTASAPDSTLPPPPAFQQLAESRAVALFLDFDGTLVEIAPGPDAIEVPADLSSRLEELGQRLDGRLALVSGRGLDNIADHVGDLAIARGGSHGAERVAADGTSLGSNPAPLAVSIVEEIQEVAAANGALFERKRFGAALHYRAAPETGPEIEAAARQIASANNLRAKSGKCVIELVHPGADKGSAVAAFMETDPFAGSLPIFIGDDVTDEDGFAQASRLGGFGIAVGDRPSQNAAYRINTVKEVYEWLKL
ncbi:trehalose-phosphatase [Altererythrobacter luteolus]|uniref:Trehalose 6-phosphate phosphatase n=1 Tax=Pontixanthobacter luteolus TaxID=295089 RepID=A0A6I4UVG6_9SPHN|nr:trehalose-phosphatase [Pontixanthobacter luteolus]MXP45857.1 trehalose-phosphatase [Pontixanthobacter luteolus]